ncbi:hypothetical protein J4E00_14905 [Siccationidurans soli]|uniref:Uncharacterized protein n=1 Tax=Hymenobacter negativus TaxID=2795026 RepID=A0ABS3QGH9_9BACT|nr:hypothetical protein [Hymenobacter negativus]
MSSSFLKLEVIWKDDHMFELRVTASNGRYSGTTEVYDTTESLAAFATSLHGFPQNDKALAHEAGERDGYAYFQMKYYPYSHAGYIGVEVSLEENVSPPYREIEKVKLKLEIVVEPPALDVFLKALSQLARKQEGMVTLYGRDN